MCKYCDVNAEEDRRILFDNGLIEIEINPNLNKLETHYNGKFECADFDGEDGYDIQYCPFCGKKLD